MRLSQKPFARGPGEASRLLAEASLYGPNLSDPEALEDAKLTLALAWEDATQDARVRELIHEAAYGRDSPLGSPLLCPPSELSALTPNTLGDFRSRLFSPTNMVVAGAGVGHDELVDLAERCFAGPHEGASLVLQLSSR